MLNQQQQTLRSKIMRFFRDQAEKLSVEEQQVFRSIYIEGKPAAGVSAALGVPVTRVDELNVSVLRKLREA